MSKIKTSTPPAGETAATSTQAGGNSTKAAAPARGDGIRETVESVVVAFVLAFLFRTFEAEAFVIPTGSMAPTLMGRHKDLTCEKCGFAYRVNAKDEVDDNSRRLVDPHTGKPIIWVDSSTCPLCRFPMDLDGPGVPDYFPSYNGDRIIVGKFPYEIGDPTRWDVVVFKYPLGAATNFIKRLVGLPGETVWIVHGDIFIKKQGEDEYTIARKSPEKLAAMLQMVYDNDYHVPSMVAAGWPARWQAWTMPVDKLFDSGWPSTGSDGRLVSPAVVTDTSTTPAGHWKTDDHRAFTTDGTKAEEVWLRYQHTVASAQDWESIEAGKPVSPRALLIENFNAYNHYSIHDVRYPQPTAEEKRILELRRDDTESPWVGDLMMQCELEVRSQDGVVVLELIEGGVHFQCRIDVATGQATLASDGLLDFSPSGQTTVKGPGVYRVAFSNVDDQLLLSVNGKVVEFDGPTTYDSHQLGSTRPKAADLAPAGIASRGAALKVDRLCLLRDLYYFDYSEAPWEARDGNGARYPLNEDQFFVLGDNSARSADARAWFGERYVHRDLLIGKALYIYWPHSWDIPGLETPLPLYPNFPRMGFVR